MPSSSTADWNPTQYERFRRERSQPFFDLLSWVRRRPGMRIVDLGCGTGELTRVLHLDLQARETLGVDSSAAMLAKSGALADVHLHFQQMDIDAFAAERAYDLVFSNATLQWLGDHDALLARLTQALADGGQLAIQVPANHDHVSHVVAAEVATEEPFRTALGGYVRVPSVREPEVYACLLDSLGYREQQVRLHVYSHHLGSRDDVVEWVKGTLLVDYQRRLPAATYEQFLERYRARLLPQLSAARPYFYPFKRILMWGIR